jgi:hypothetical protein
MIRPEQLTSLFRMLRHQPVVSDLIVSGSTDYCGVLELAGWINLLPLRLSLRLLQSSTDWGGG